MIPRAFALLALASTSCDLFGEVRCSSDADCPESVAFCVEGVCAEDPEVERDGPCTEDAECGRELCYDIDDDTGANGSCVPKDVVDDCAAALEEPTRSRDDEGPALFDVTLLEGTGACSGEPSFRIAFRYLDREGDMPRNDEFVASLFVRLAAGEFASSSALVGSPFIGADPEHAGDVVYEACDPAPTGDIAVWLEDRNGHRSNVVCASP